MKKQTEINTLFFFPPGCTDDIVTSDHSPVFATFEVGVTSQFVSKKGKKVFPVSCTSSLFGVTVNAS